MRQRLCIFVTHPVQYYVPFWRALSAHPALDVTVYYFSDLGVHAPAEVGFGVPVRWDVDLLSGYRHVFVSRDGDPARPMSMRLPDVHGLLAEAKPDWIWISGYTHVFELQLVQAARRHGAKILMRADFSDLSLAPRSPIKQLFRSAFLRQFYSRVDRFCYTGELGLRHLRRLGVPALRAYFSPYAVDDEMIVRQREALTREDARRNLGIPEHRLMFLFSGKLIPRKDPLGLLDALRGLSGLDRAGLIVLGDGELRAAFEPLARELFGDRLIFPGFVNQSQLGKYLAAGDVFVLPSRYETWGLVVNEAMLFGMPAIVSDQVGCHPDLVRQGSTGFVYACGNGDELSRCLQRMLADPLKARKMGTAARTLASQYTIEASARGVFQALGLT